MTIATSNDYEEGTEVENGIDNCYRLANASFQPDSVTVIRWAVEPTTNDSATIHGVSSWAVI